MLMLGADCDYTKSCQNPFYIRYINIHFKSMYFCSKFCVCIFFCKHHIIVSILLTHMKKWCSQWLFLRQLYYSMCLSEKESAISCRLTDGKCRHALKSTFVTCTTARGKRKTCRKSTHTLVNIYIYICQAHFHPLYESGGWKMRKSFFKNHTFRMLFPCSKHVRPYSHYMWQCETDFSQSGWERKKERKLKRKETIDRMSTRISNLLCCCWRPLLIRFNEWFSSYG